MYRFDKHTLEFVKLHWPIHALKGTVVFLLLFFLFIFIMPTVKKAEMEREAMVIVAQRNEFSEEKLIEMIKHLNFPFPYIVLAQAIHETNHYSSPVYIENHNLFGMKQAIVRITTSRSTNRDHAVYDSWMDSVYDRAFYSATYLSNVKTEEDYYSFLSQSYAIDKEYVSKLKEIIEQYKLKEKF